MDATITIAAPAETVLAWIADPRRLPDWLPDLRRDRDGDVPTEGMEAHANGIAWSFDPPGAMHVTGAGDVATLTITLVTDTAQPSDPTERETPKDAALHAITAALRSIKFHIEAVGGGDPVLSTEGAPARLYGRTTTNDPVI
jgi:uncharacterized protein YndB with AHSA1/START domain